MKSIIVNENYSEKNIPCVLKEKGNDTEYFEKILNAYSQNNKPIIQSKCENFEIGLKNPKENNTLRKGKMKENTVVKCKSEENIDFSSTANGGEIKNFNINNSVDGLEPKNLTDVEMISSSKESNEHESNNNDSNERIKNKMNSSDEIEEIKNVKTTSEIENLKFCDTVIDLENDLSVSDKSPESVQLSKENSYDDNKLENDKTTEEVDENKENKKIHKNNDSEIIQVKDNPVCESSTMKESRLVLDSGNDLTRVNENSFKFLHKSYLFKRKSFYFAEKSEKNAYNFSNSNHNDSSKVRQDSQKEALDKQAEINIIEEDDLAEVIEFEAKGPIVSKDSVKTTEKFQKANVEKETKEKTEIDQKARFNLRKRSRLNSYGSSKKKKIGECVQGAETGDENNTSRNSSLSTNEKPHSLVSSETNNETNDNCDSFHGKNAKKQKIDNREKETVPSSFLSTLRGTLKNLTRNDLEELIVQKLCEVITERSVVGELRRRTQALEEDQEKWKVKAQSLSKQIKEMEMIMRKYLNEVQKQTKAGSDHLIVPLRVTRSVGLQVSFLSNANKLSKGNTTQTDSGTNEISPNLHSKNSKLTPQKFHVKQNNSSQGANQKCKPGPSNEQLLVSTPTTTPTHYKKKSNVSKTESNCSLLLPSTVTYQNNKSNNSNAVSKLNTKINSPLQTSHQPQQNQQNNSKIIDLTDDDDRQAPSLVDTSRLVKVVNYPLRQTQGTPNNRYTYILPNSNITPTVVSTPQNRQVLLAASACPPQSNNRQIMSMPPLLFKGGSAQQPGFQTSVFNQSNHVIPSKLLKHPAPLPQQPAVSNQKSNSKLLPPRPALKISRVQSGIVLSWNMSLGPEHAAISSYQLYAYQEGNSPPATSLWKKVGDVKALPLPMACTLTQFTSGHKYHFAVRAVDQHSRVGPFSLPGTIALVK